MILNKTLSRNHPYKLIGWTCLSGAVFYFSVYSNFDMFYFDYTALLGYSLFNFNNKHKYMYILIFTWKLLHYLSTTIHITLNFLAQLDIFLTLKQPFKSRENRQKYFIIGLLVISIATLIIIFNPYNFVLVTKTLTFYDHEETPTLNNLMFGITAFAYCIATIMTIIVAFRLKMKGSSEDLKKYYLLRHVVYFFFFSLVVFDTLLDQLTFEQEYDCQTYTFENIKNGIISSIRNLGGFFLAWIRVSEPFVRQTLRNDLTKLGLCSKQKVKKIPQFAKVPLDS